MAIRIRRVDGVLVALCAAKTEPMKGDQYIDDEVDHAIRIKLDLDLEAEAVLPEYNETRLGVHSDAEARRIIRTIEGVVVQRAPVKGDRTCLACDRRGPYRVEVGPEPPIEIVCECGDRFSLPDVDHAAVVRFGAGRLRWVLSGGNVYAFSVPERAES